MVVCVCGCVCVSVCLCVSERQHYVVCASNSCHASKRILYWCCSVVWCCIVVRCSMLQCVGTFAVIHTQWNSSVAGCCRVMQ